MFILAGTFVDLPAFRICAAVSFSPLKTLPMASDRPDQYPDSFIGMSKFNLIMPLKSL
jgi:hypothetical protein